MCWEIRIASLEVDGVEAEVAPAKFPPQAWRKRTRMCWEIHIASLEVDGVGGR
jgi:hypothetical protein